MGDIVATETGHVVAMVALGILAVIETVTLPSNLILLCLFRGDRMAKLYPQESVRIGAAGYCILGCLLGIVYIPTCMVLLSWHATLDKNPMLCLGLCMLAITLSMSAQCNMFYMSAHFAFTILRPLHVDAIFTRRRGLISYVITVYVIPVVITTIWGSLSLVLTEKFYEDRIVCLAFLNYWPRWTLQVATFGFLIPVTAASFVLNSYLVYIARKQAKRTIDVQMDQEPVQIGCTTQQLRPTSEIQINNKGDTDDSRNKNTGASPSGRGHSGAWKGARLIYINISAAFLFIIPAYCVTGTVTFCQDCLPAETALVVLFTVFSMTSLGPVCYHYSSSRVREIIKKDICMCWKPNNQG